MKIDIHVHSDISDGTDSIEKILDKAKERWLNYLYIDKQIDVKIFPIKTFSVSLRYSI